MEFENIEERESPYKKNCTHKCEECGYTWVEEVAVNDNLFESEDEGEYCCPICGGSYLDHL